jgi:glycosyltransferase involved in cell wall biosynthesis
LIAVSRFTKRCVVDALGYPPERIQVVYEAANRELFKPLSVPAVFRRKYALHEGERYVLYVGSEDPRKNVKTLIRAFAIVHEQMPTAKLIKAGPPQFVAQRESLLSLVTALGLEGRVCFLDHVPDGDLPLLYNTADVFVLPSLYEGFSLPALEAMSCGTPIVASNRASLLEVVGEGGVLVDPEDVRTMAQHIVELISDPKRRAAASQAALEQAGRFSLQRQTDETVAVYTEVA